MAAGTRYWDKVARFYDLIMSERRAGYDRIAARFASWVGPEHTVLELGAGPGSLTRHLAPSTGPYTMTDASAEMVERARSKVSHLANVTVGQEDAQALSFPDGSFDRVVMANMLHIVPDPRAVLLEASRVVAEDGCILIANFVLDDPDRPGIGIKLLELTGYELHAGWTPERFEEFLRGTGLIIEESDHIDAMFRTQIVRARPSR